MRVTSFTVQYTEDVTGLGLDSLEAGSPVSAF